MAHTPIDTETESHSPVARRRGLPRHVVNDAADQLTPTDADSMFLGANDIEPLAALPRARGEDVN